MRGVESTGGESRSVGGLGSANAAGPTRFSRIQVPSPFHSLSHFWLLFQSSHLYVFVIAGSSLKLTPPPLSLPLTSIMCICKCAWPCARLCGYSRGCTVHRGGEGGCCGLLSFHSYSVDVCVWLSVFVCVCEWLYLCVWLLSGNTISLWTAYQPMNLSGFKKTTSPICPINSYDLLLLCLTSEKRFVNLKLNSNDARVE